MRTYPALGVMVRYGGGVAACAGCGVLLLCLWTGLAGAGLGFWVVAGLVAGAAVGFLLLVMRDIVRIIADTLIPAP